MKTETIISILYALAAICFFAFLATRKSGLMFCGGLLLIAASLMLLIYKKKE